MADDRIAVVLISLELSRLCDLIDNNSTRICPSGQYSEEERKKPEPLS